MSSLANRFMLNFPLFCIVTGTALNAKDCDFPDQGKIVR